MDILLQVTLLKTMLDSIVTYLNSAVDTKEQKPLLTTQVELPLASTDYTRVNNGRKKSTRSGTKFNTKLIEAAVLKAAGSKKAIFLFNLTGFYSLESGKLYPLQAFHEAVCNACAKMYGHGKFSTKKTDDKRGIAVWSAKGRGK